MKIFISGICGTGMGPLALMARDAGLEVYGSDLSPGAILPELQKSGVNYKIGPQDGEFLQKSGAEWYIHTSALPENSKELQVAKDLGLKISKRDELIAHLVEKLNLKMVAIAGTHGKTTTTGMLIWACQKLNLPASYLIGTTLGFAESGKYHRGDKYFIYEADEYDRNFLHFSPWLGVVTIATYDHPDIYPTKEDYQKAFQKFESQSQKIIKGGVIDHRLTLAGKLRREDATTALKVIKTILKDYANTPKINDDQIISILNAFPCVGRRFERISNGVYSDYGHHPEEIKSTVEMALEEAKRNGFKGVVAIYEPHQNIRQHRVKEGYQDAFKGVSKLYWLPTYLTREDPNLPIITPEDFIKTLENSQIAEPRIPDASLVQDLKKYHDDGYLILLLTAGPADTWLRKNF